MAITVRCSWLDGFERVGSHHAKWCSQSLSTFLSVTFFSANRTNCEVYRLSFNKRAWCYCTVTATPKNLASRMTLLKGTGKAPVLFTSGSLIAVPSQLFLRDTTFTVSTIHKSNTLLLIEPHTKWSNLKYIQTSLVRMYVSKLEIHVPVKKAMMSLRWRLYFVWFRNAFSVGL